MKHLWMFTILFFLLISSCQPAADASPDQDLSDAAHLTLTSPAFNKGDPIPVQYTCDGVDISPALTWADPPVGTQSFAIIMDDPDAPSGDWVHWVIYNIPAGTRALDEAISTDETLPDGSLHGKNNWKDYGYGGPCPPGGTHRYFFKLYALDTVLEVDAGLSKTALMEQMLGHVLGFGQLMGTYTR